MSMNENINNLMKEAQKMQQRMQEAQKELSELRIIGKAGGGLVEIEVNGRFGAMRVKINPSLVDDIQMLEDLVAAAFNDAVYKVEKASQEKVSQLTKGLNIPTEFMKDNNEE